MEALGLILLIIVALVALALVIIFLGFLWGLLIWIYMLLPFVVGIIGGLIVWATGNKSLGNIMVFNGVIIGIFWEIHMWKKMDSCNCPIHEILFFLRGDYFEKRRRK